MTSSLQRLFNAINQAANEHTLRSHVAPKISTFFAATRSGIFFFNQLKVDRNFGSVANIVLSIKHNPIARYIAERHTPVHEGLVTTPKTWTIICPRPDHWHVMAGPIIDRGQLVGAVGRTREKSMPAFDTQNLADLSAICLHLSIWVTAISLQRGSKGKSEDQPFKADSQCNNARLTPRELQIVALVAQGQTNAEIGMELWITENSVKQALKRIFRKLEVSSRAAMVAQPAVTQSSLLGIK